jgi:hypothetical protein
MIELGYAIGLYKNIVRNDLHVIRTIRNGFAHATNPLEFRHKLIRAEIEKLQFLEWTEAARKLAILDGFETEKDSPSLKNLSLARKYVYTCTQIANDLRLTWPRSSGKKKEIILP